MHTYVNIAQNCYGALIWKMKEAMEKFQLQSWQVGIEKEQNLVY